MLSKLSCVVLGLINQRPLNPYELTKLLDRSEIQDWFPMTSASIYTTIKNLSKKGYIIGESVKEGNLPSKTVYSITDEGKKILINSLEIGLESYSPQASDFGISIFHVCSLEKNLALELLTKRLETLKTMKSVADDKLNSAPPKTPTNFKMMLQYNVYRFDTEIKITEQLFNEFKNDNNWNYSFTKLLDY